jgi:fucose 4-O-acetylase-like acetyltransferase
MKELKYITLAQLVGCLLVIWGHSYPFVADLPVVIEQGKSFIYQFHMPLFIFCSGYLLVYTKQIDRKSFSEYVGQRAKRLLIPYFVLSLIGVIPKFLFSSVLNDSLSLDAISLTRAFFVPRENIWGHFWFLPMIFFMGVIAFLIEKYILRSANKSVGWGIITLVLMICSIIYKPANGLEWFGINDIIIYGWSYSLGVIVYYLLGDIKEKVNIAGWETAVICIVGGAFLC